MYYRSRIAGSLAAAGLITAAWWSVLLSRADAQFRKSTPEGVTRAVDLAPRNTQYLSLRALEIEYAGGDPRPLLERWAAIAPLSSAPRIRLGLDAEVRGDVGSAERWLLDAARVDHQFEPRWTLANFYFRQQRADEFWKWMRLALERSYSDRRPVFDLCWQMTSNPAQILAALPAQRDTLAAYLAYTMDSRRPEAAGPAAVKLASLRDPDDRAALYSATDWLLDAGRGGDAAEVWTALGYAAPQGIVSPDFDAPRIGHGFDWRRIESSGVAHLDEDSPPAHKIVFSGDQPESCELLRQPLALRKGSRYRLRWESRTSGIASPTGIVWLVSGQSGVLATRDEWAPAQFEFTAERDLEMLSLMYRRPSGQVRASGSLELRHVRLEPAP